MTYFRLKPARGVEQLCTVSSEVKYILSVATGREYIRLKPSCFYIGHYGRSWCCHRVVAADERGNVINHEHENATFCYPIKSDLRDRARGSQQLRNEWG